MERNIDEYRDELLKISKQIEKMVEEISISDEPFMITRFSILEKLLDIKHDIFLCDGMLNICKDKLQK